MWSRTPWAEPKNSAWRRWLTLSGPIEPLLRWPRYHWTFSREAARKAAPAPAKVMFDVEAYMIARWGCPAAATRLRMSALLASSLVRWWSAYALSQRILKSGAAVSIDASRAATAWVVTAPVGLAYVGTTHIPLTLGSAAASRATASTSGPSSFMGTVTISMP